MNVFVIRMLITASAALLAVATSAQAQQTVPMLEINRLIQAGKTADALSKLQIQADSAHGEEKARLEKIIAGLKGYRESRGVKPAEQPVFQSWALKRGEQGSIETIVSSLGGYRGAWAVALEDYQKGKAPYQEQRFARSTEFPLEWCRTQREQGFHITGLAGDASQWLVAMSSPSPYAGQVVLHTPGGLPEKVIQEQWAKGWHITAVAGYQSTWRLIMSQRNDDAWGEQKISAIGPVDKPWMESLWKQGYRVTSIAGDYVQTETKDQTKPNETYLVVMTRMKSDYGQFYKKSIKSADMPAFLEEQKAKGNRISGIAGYKDRWTLVCDQKATPASAHLWWTGTISETQTPPWSHAARMRNNLLLKFKEMKLLK